MNNFNHDLYLRTDFSPSTQKNKIRRKIDLEYTLRIATTCIKPDIDELMFKKKKSNSH